MKNGEQSMKCYLRPGHMSGRRHFSAGKRADRSADVRGRGAETLLLNEGYPLVGLSGGSAQPVMGYEDIKKAEVYAKEGKYHQVAQVLNQAQGDGRGCRMYELSRTVRIRLRESGRL